MNQGGGVTKWRMSLHVSRVSHGGFGHTNFMSHANLWNLLRLTQISQISRRALASLCCHTGENSPRITGITRRFWAHGFYVSRESKNLRIFFRRIFIDSLDLREIFCVCKVIVVSRKSGESMEFVLKRYMWYMWYVEDYLTQNNRIYFYLTQIWGILEFVW